MSHAYSRVRRGIVAFGALLLIAASSSFAQWVDAPSVPQARTFVAVTADNQAVYAFGGSLDGRISPTGIPSTATSTAWRLNAAGSSWTQLAAMPQTRTAGAAIEHNGNVYIIGGITYNGTTRAYTPTVLEYSTTMNTYTAKAAMPIPVFGFAAAKIGTKIYVIGGIGQNGTNFSFPKTVQIYDIQTNTWSQSANDFPYSMIYGSMTAIGQNLYVVGGVDANGSTFPTVQTAYKGAVSPNGIIWTQIANYPLAVSGQAGGNLNAKAYFAGGQTTDGISVRNCYYYDEGTSSWKGGYGLPNPLCHNMQMGYDGTWMYYVSGSDGNKKTFKLKEGASVAVAEVGPTSFHLTAKTGSTVSAKINVTNWGIVPLDGSINIPAEAQSWANTPNGAFTNIVPGTSQELTLNFGGAAISEGNYRTTIVVNTNDPNKASTDVVVNLYVRNELPEQPTVVVLEESSGAWCGPCGAYGVPEVRRLNDQFGSDLITIAYHDRGGRGASADTLATTETEAIGARLGVPFFPAAAVSRYLFPGQTGQMIDLNSWEPAINAVRATIPNAQVALNVKQFKFDPATKTITAKLELTTGVAIPLGSTSLRVTGVVLEDSILYAQNGATSPFHHMHVARSFWPNINGQEVTLPDGTVEDNVLLPNSKIPVEVTYVVPKYARWQQCHMVFMAHINSGNAFGPILQGHELSFTEEVKPGGGGSGVELVTVGANGMKLSQNVPNPASGMTSFEFTQVNGGNVEAEIFSMAGDKVFGTSFGRVEAGTHVLGINVASLPNGVYSVRFSSNGHGVSRMITVTR